MITRIDLIHPVKHPAMGPAEMPSAQFSVDPPTPGDYSYELEPMPNGTVRILRDGKFHDAYPGNIKGTSGVWGEKPAAKAKR